MSAKNYRSRSTGRSGSKSTNRSKKFNDNENRKRVRTESPSPRRNQGKRAKTAEGTDGSSGRTQKTVLLPKLILVLDTNILLERSGLQFLEEIAAGKYDAADLPPIQIFIPHVSYRPRPYQPGPKQYEGALGGMYSLPLLEFRRSNPTDKG